MDRAKEIEVNSLTTNEFKIAEVNLYHVIMF